MLSSTLLSLLAFGSIRAVEYYTVSGQTVVIVYNVPKRQAVDIIEGKEFEFVGDEELGRNDSMQNIYLNPARVKYRVSSTHSTICVIQNLKLIRLNSAKVLLLNQPTIFVAPATKIVADLIVVSKDAAVDLSNLNSVFSCTHYVFDESNGQRKIRIWKKECASLGLPCHFVGDDGAFILKGH